jgi:hypothetical protein
MKRMDGCKNMRTTDQAGTFYGFLMTATAFAVEP